MENRIVSNHIKDVVYDNIDAIDWLCDDCTEEFKKQFYKVIDENEGVISSKMQEIREKINSEMLSLGDKINCDEDDFEDFLKDYQAGFLISQKNPEIVYMGIFHEDEEYPKFDEETYILYLSEVYIPFMM